MRRDRRTYRGVSLGPPKGSSEPLDRMPNLFEVKMTGLCDKYLAGCSDLKCDPAGFQSIHDLPGLFGRQFEYRGYGYTDFSGLSDCRRQAGQAAHILPVRSVIVSFRSLQ